MNFSDGIVVLRDCGYWQGPGKLGKSLNFIVACFRTGKSWKKAVVPWKLWNSRVIKTRVIKWNVWQTVRWINIEILGVRGFMRILKYWETQSECWKILEICFWKRVRTLDWRLRVLITDLFWCRLTPGHWWPGHSWLLLDLIATLLVNHQSAKDNNDFTAAELRLR